MKKSVVAILVVIALVLAMAVAGAVGFLWYRNNHIFVDGDAYPIDSESLDLTGEDISIAYYEALQAKLPDCEIRWMVPFRDGKYADNTESLLVSELTLEDVELLAAYFPNLKTLDAMQCENYEILAVAEATLPHCEVIYDVDLGGPIIDHKAADLVTGFGEDADYDTLMKNLVYLPNLKRLTLTEPALSLEQVDALRDAYPKMEISCIVKILGQEYAAETTEIDLSAMADADLEEVTQKLSMLPNLTHIDLNGSNSVSPLSMATAKALMEALPNVVIDYKFDFYGEILSTAEEEVHIKNKKIGDEGEETVRLALDLMKHCKRFVLEYCQLSNEVLAKIRDDYRHQTKVVWRVSYGKGNTLTDAEVIRAVYDLVDDNCHNLIYCEDAKYMDIGHNEWLDACDFVSGMKSLEYVIISGAPIKSLEPFRSCKNLKFLEAAFCEYITDVSPLAECKNLQMLNISNTHVTDLSPLDDLPLTHLTVRTNPSGKCRLSQEEQDRITAQHPDCWISFAGAQPYGVGWRYDEDEITPLPQYQVIRTVFRLDLDPNIPNHVGWYLKDQERAEVDKLEEGMQPAAVPEETVPEETTPETTVMEENNE